MKTILVVSSDSHSGSRVGLCPPVFRIRATEGGQLECHATPAQLAMWKAWTGFWFKMRYLADALQAMLIGFHLGDGADDAKGKQAGLVSAHKSDILDVAEAVAEPMVQAVDELYIANGTEFHVGEAGWLEEELARRVGAVPSPDGAASWWVIRKEIDGIKVHAAHHPPSKGFRPWTENGATSLCSANLKMRYLDMGQECPDIALFGHVHFPADSGAMTKPRVFFCPGWQMMTAFDARMGMAGIMRPIGGWYFIIEDGHYTVEPDIHYWRRESVWS